MDEELVNKSESLFDRLEKIEKFSSKYKVLPIQETEKIVNEIETLASSIPDIEKPKNEEELIQAELKRRLKGESASLTHTLSGKPYDFDSIISLYAIPKSDIKGLKPWLEANKTKTLESIERLFKTKNVQSYDLGLPTDLSGVGEQATKMAGQYIQAYHNTLGTLLQNITKAGEFLKKINAIPTTSNRSYFSPRLNILGISIPAICYMTEDRNFYIDERRLISLYGHEGMGHALNQVITHSKNLPKFLKKDHNIIRPTVESVAQFYEKQIFEDIKASQEAQKALKLDDRFEEIYQEAKDTMQIEGYQRKLFGYAITVLADKSLGNSKSQKTLAKKKDLIAKLAVNPVFAPNFIEEHKNHFDTQGNLYPQLVSELIYSAQPVERALEEFKKQGIEYEGEYRSKIDLTLLKGLWTPTGFVDKARLAAERYKK